MKNIFFCLKAWKWQFNNNSLTNSPESGNVFAKDRVFKKFRTGVLISDIQTGPVGVQGVWCGVVGGWIVYALLRGLNFHSFKDGP